MERERLKENIRKLTVLSGEEDEELLEFLLLDAEEYVLSYTNRKRLPSALEKPVRDLAVIALNRRGREKRRELFKASWKIENRFHNYP